MDDDVRRILISQLRALGASRDDAEDCVQEALAAAWTNSADGQPPRDLLAWLTTVARRRYVDLVRAERRQTELTRQAGDEHDRTDPTPEQQIVERHHAQWLAARLEALPQQTQEVCEAATTGLPPAQIVAELRMRPRSVEAHLYRARRFIRIQAALGVPSLLAAAWRWVRGHATVVGVTATCATVSLAYLLLPVPDVPADAAEPPALPLIAAAPPVPMDKYPGTTEPSTRDTGSPTTLAETTAPDSHQQTRQSSTAMSQPVTEPARVIPKRDVGPPDAAAPALVDIDQHPEQIRTKIDTALRDAMSDVPACPSQPDYC